MSDARQRIGRIIGDWTFSQPLLLAAWNLHSLHENNAIQTVRVGQRRIEFSTDYVGQLNDRELSELLRFEMVRVVLGHPYDRRRSDAELSFVASNLTVQECLHSSLPIPPAAEMFDDAQLSGQHFELYYHELSQRRTGEDDQTDASSAKSDADEDHGDSPSSHDNPDADDSANPEADDDSDSNADDDAANEQSSPLQSHVQTTAAASNVELWEDDALLREQIDLAIAKTDTDNTWGDIGAGGREVLRDRIPVRLDYASVLRNFKRSITSSQRTLTRMRANRRYGLDQLGSRFTTQIRLLVALDVSGSMSSSQIEKGLAIVNRMFRHGVSRIDVLKFDQQIQGDVERLHRRRSSISIGGRGGTDFQCVIDFLTRHRGYDGAIIYTDGQASLPSWPTTMARRQRTPLVWLMSDRERFEAVKEEFRDSGRVTYIA